MGTSAAFVAHSVPLSLILPSLLLLVSPDSCRGGRDLLLAVAAIANRITLPASTFYPKRSRRASQWRDGRRSRRSVVHVCNHSDWTACGPGPSLLLDEQILAGRLEARCKKHLKINLQPAHGPASQARSRSSYVAS